MTLPAERVLSCFDRDSGQTLRMADLVRELGLRPAERRELRRVVRTLVSEGSLQRLGHGRFARRVERESVRGELFGYGDDLRFRGGDGEESLPVPPEWSAGAAHGDQVEIQRIRLPPSPDRPPQAAARVVRLLRRAERTALAVYRSGERGGNGYALPQDAGLPPRLALETPLAGARNGDLILVALPPWSSGEGPAAARPLRLLREGETPHRFFLLLQEFGLPLAFPSAVLEEASAAARAAGADGSTLPDAELAGREDLRGVLTLTIDPADAYDHDDAVSLEGLPGGGWRAGVHIADVTRFVAAGSAVDREAVARGTSVYLDCGVVPMLPEELTRDILSLKADRDRCCLSLLADLSPAGEVRSFRVVPSVIRSDRLLSYEEAEGFLGGEDGGEPGRAVREMWRVAEALRARRAARGALDFDAAEPEVVRGPGGLPRGIVRRARLRSHRLVEEFMLLANECVARYLGRHGKALIYRVHESPDDASLETLQQTLRTLGYRLPGGELTAALSDVLRQAQGARDAELVTMLVLRSMKRATYDTRNRGHFGLASSDYAHFTSPIRRYPDVTVHRALRSVWGAAPPGARGEALAWEKDAGGSWRPPPREPRREGVEARSLAQTARHATRREMQSDAAERAAFQEACALYMQERLGEEFEGLIVGFNRAGFFARLFEMPVEGMVPFGSLGRERFVFWEESALVRGERTGATYRLGEEVLVRVARADADSRQIDFELVAHTPRRGPAPGARARRGHPAPKRAEPRRGRRRRGPGPAPRGKRR